MEETSWQQAWQWLCRTRRRYPANVEIWDLWFKGEEPRIRRQVGSGTYRLSAMCVVGSGGNAHAVWRDRDALVLKWLALELETQLPQSARCFHVRHRGGPRALLQQVDAALRSGRQYVCRTDIRGYYRHIRKASCLAHIRQWVSDPVQRDLAEQYLNYSVEQGGEFHTPDAGIPRGCALSPLLGEVFCITLMTIFRHGRRCFMRDIWMIFYCWRGRGGICERRSPG